MLTLSDAETLVTLQPSLGGSIHTFAVRGIDVFRPAPPGTRDTLQVGCFPLVPWVNRISQGSFTFQDQQVSVPPTLESEPLPLHGHGWIERWEVVEQTSTAARLRFLHRPGRWPWAYEAFQNVEIDDGRLTVTLSATNLTDADMPASLGLHPYFERPARVSFNVDGMWETDRNLLPVDWRSATSFRAHDVGRLALDNCFTGWDRRAIVDGPAGHTQIQSNLDYLHVYIPRSGGAFCLEPVSAAPDALNHPERGLAALAPGETMTGWMRVQVST